MIRRGYNVVEVFFLSLHNDVRMTSAVVKIRCRTAISHKRNGHY